MILCFVGSISNVIPYSILGTNVSVLCGVVKELCDSEFNKEDLLATMFGGIIAIVISLFSLLKIANALNCLEDFNALFKGVVVSDLKNFNPYND